MFFRIAILTCFCWLFKADLVSSELVFTSARKLKEDASGRKSFEGSVEKTESERPLHDPELSTAPQHVNISSHLQQLSYRGGALPDTRVPSRVPKISKAEFRLRRIPPFIDWRRSNCIADPKMQGSLTSPEDNCQETCWAFATIGLLEYHYCVSRNQLFRLSEKYIVDCKGNGGCRGGRVPDALDFVKAQRWIPSEAAYPYVTVWQTCQHEIIREHDMGNLRGYDYLTGDLHLLKALATQGPVAAYMLTNMTSFLDYRTTDEDHIFSDPICEHVPRSVFTHAVLVIGYGTNHNGKYWLVKNSWGPQWGYNGYFKLRRNKKNYCNIAGHLFVPKFR